MITPIGNLHFTPAINQKQQQKAPISLRPQLAVDTVSFGNTSPDLMSLSDKEIFEKVLAAIKNEEIIGQGGEATVYRIPDSNYCVRKSYRLATAVVPLKKKQFTRNVTAQDKVNHVVAKIGNYLTIMPILQGSPVMNPVTMSEKEAKKISEAICLFPQSSFNKLLKQINDAYEKDMMWDCNWANIIANPKEKTLTAIDFYKNSMEESASHLAYMYAGLVHEHTTEQQCKMLAEKVMNAGLEEFKPGVTPCCNFDKFGFSDLIRAFDDLDLFTSKRYTKLLLDLTYKMRDLKNQEIRGINVTNELNFELKKIQSIMRQLVKY